MALPASTLEYPEKFKAAAHYVDNLPDGVQLSDETRLALYALYQQTTVGPCKEAKPWGWNVVHNAKWQYWKELGDLPSLEAMRLYVRTLEEEAPSWAANLSWTPEAEPDPSLQALSMGLAAKASSGEEAGEEKRSEEKPDDGARRESARPRDSSQARDPSQARGSAPPPPTPPQESASEAASEGSAPPPPSARASHKPPTSHKSRSVAEVVVEGSWVSPYIASARKPVPRYEHATALVGNQLVVVGGNAGGRYLRDAWALNLEDLGWTPLATHGEGPPPFAGHSATAWRGGVVVVGGHARSRGRATREESLRVWRLDVTEGGGWTELATRAEEGSDHALPRARGGHSATLLGHSLVVFGGEDEARRALDELWVLDLESLVWRLVKAAGPCPRPRSAHTAAALLGRYLLVFGGGSVASCFDDVHVLDTATSTWHVPRIEGPPPPPRAGHAAALLGDTWYVVGGGNNARGCADMYALEIAAVALEKEVEEESTAPGMRWVLVGHTPVESAIAAEGLSLQCVPMAGCLVAFGGYNGRYHNALHVYRPEGFVVVKGPAGGGSNGSLPAAGGAQAEGAAAQARDARLDEAEAARREALAAKESAAHEVALLRRQLASAQGGGADLEKELREAREALAAEQARRMRLEVQVAELQSLQPRLAELEQELEAARGAGRVGGSEKPPAKGLWGFISGADQAADKE